MVDQPFSKIRNGKGVLIGYEKIIRYRNSGDVGIQEENIYIDSHAGRRLHCSFFFFRRVSCLNQNYFQFYRSSPLTGY